MIRWPWFAIVVPTFLCGATIVWMGSGSDGLNAAPGRQGDDVFFENLAFQLAEHGRFAFDFTDPDWQQPYRNQNQAGSLDWVFDIRVVGQTTSRSPAYPCFIAALYSSVGRHWSVVRIASAVMLISALSTWIYTLDQFAGRAVACVAMLTLGVDFAVMRTPIEFMSEALATSWLCLLSTCLVRAYALRQQRDGMAVSKWLVIGLIFGVGCLIRGQTNVWLILIVLAGVFAVSYRYLTRQPTRWSICCGLSFLLGVLLVASPWWIRNCRVTKSLSPFGTAGVFGLTGGYCDGAYRDGGNWHLETSLKSQTAALQQPGFLSHTLPEQEFLMGQESARRAWEWMGQHPTKLFPLMIKKAVSHLGFYRQPTVLLIINALLWIGALIGCAQQRDNIGLWIFLLMLLSIFTTMLTWSHFGRYSIPLRPLVHGAHAWTVVWIAQRTRLLRMP